MRISDWSSDVCSSDLQHVVERIAAAARRFDKDAQVLAHRPLPDEVIEVRRPESQLAGILLAEVRRQHALLCPSVVHDASSLRPALMRDRSEEHTSELQSLMSNSYAVVCLKTKKH